jgi:hypothetical protein
VTCPHIFCVDCHFLCQQGTKMHDILLKHSQRGNKLKRHLRNLSPTLWQVQPSNFGNLTTWKGSYYIPTFLYIWWNPFRLCRVSHSFFFFSKLNSACDKKFYYKKSVTRKMQYFLWSFFSRMNIKNMKGVKGKVGKRYWPKGLKISVKI